MLNEIRRKLLEHKEMYSGINLKEIEEKENKYTYIQFRCSEGEKEIIQACARLKNQNVSEFLRQLVLNDYLKEFLK